MADISKVTILDGTTYNLKDDNITTDRVKPAATKTYTDFLATANDNQGAGFFFAKINPPDYNSIWYIKFRIYITAGTNANYQATTISEIWGTANTYVAYRNQNAIKSTSYRPAYYVAYFAPSSTGFTNGVRGWYGINLYQSKNPTMSSLKRTMSVELLDFKNCTVELQDSLITPDNIPNRASHTDWYTSTNTSYTNLNFCDNGLQETGDANTTTITNLNTSHMYHYADSAVYRYQMLFSMSDDRVTPLNNDNNVVDATKTILTNVEFNPFGRILYYASTTAIAADTLINNSGPAYAFDNMDLRYTFNITDGTATATVNKLDPYKYTYLKVTPLSNGKVKIASAAPLVQELPSSADGYWYIQLGYQYDWYRMVLLSNHPVYEYIGGKIREVKRGTYIYDLAGSGANLTDLNASNFASGTVPAERVGYLPASIVTSGTFNTARIPDLDAAKIATGTIDTARIPSLNADKVASGTLAAARLPASGVTSGSYGPSADASPTYGGTFSVPYVTVDDKGRTTAAATKTITLPAYSNATSSVDGLMSATDKSKLDNLSTIQLSSGINLTEDTDGLIVTFVD